MKVIVSTAGTVPDSLQDDDGCEMELVLGICYAIHYILLDTEW